MTRQPHRQGPDAAARSSRLGVTAAACVVFVGAMVGMSYAAVPLYRIFCQVTGYDGTTIRATAAPTTVADRVVTVRFDANVANGLGWSFRPLQREVRVRVGEVTEIAFAAESRTKTPTVGTATFNVTPLVAGAYFNKIDCFCFTEQSLKPGEVVKMPVVFFVDPTILDNSELDFVDTITLSYTFFPASGAAQAARTMPQSESRL